MPIMIQNASKKLMCADHKIPKMYCENDVIYSSGTVVTYVVRGTKYAQEYDEGESVLSPTVVSPSISGATFLGWSTSPNSTTVVSSLKMGDDPITLYAVFRYSDKTVPFEFYFVDSVDTGVNISNYSSMTVSAHFTGGEGDYVEYYYYNYFNDVIVATTDDTDQIPGYSFSNRSFPLTNILTRKLMDSNGVRHSFYGYRTTGTVAYKGKTVVG